LTVREKADHEPEFKEETTMKKIIAIVLCALMCLSCVALAETAADTTAPAATEEPVIVMPEETPNLDKIRQDGVIIMLTNAAFPPFEYLADELDEDGNPVVIGVDADIAAEIAADLGVELQIVDMDFDSIIIAVQQGKGDFGAAGMTVRPDREEMVSFSIKYVKSSQYVLVRADDTSITAAEHLQGKVIGVQMGTTGDFYASDEIPGATVVPYNDAVAASLDLANGRIDAVITDEMPARSIADANERLKVLELVLTEEEYAIAVSKDKPDLLAAINMTLLRLQREGKIEVFINNHMGLPAPEAEAEVPAVTDAPAAN
jgi:polar amino acid transport system substrate-binding protein